MAEDGKVAMVFSRTAPKAKPKVALQDEEKAEQRDYIGHVSGSKLASLAPKVEAPKPIIAALPNTFETGKGKKQRGVPSFVPPPSNNVGEGGDRFEVALQDEVAQVGNVEYGLNKRQRPEGQPDDTEEAAPRERSFVEREMERKAMSREAQESAQFKEDLDELPEESNLDAYDAMPIENFGEAMLRGMGWQEGKPVGRNAKAVVKPIEYFARPRGLGLGAQPVPEAPSDRKYIKPGESREAQAHMVLPEGPDGRIRNIKTVDEKLVEKVKAGVHVGKTMVVVNGPHAGLAGEVRAIERREGRSDRATIRLVLSGSEISVRCSELVDVGTRAADYVAADRGGAGAGPSKQADTDAGSNKSSKREEERPVGKAQPAPWLTPGIRVRIVSQKLQGGKLYLVKGTISDVTTPYEGSIALDGGKLVEGVHQRHLETVVPKGSGRIHIVAGPHKGQRGKMLSKVDGGDAATVQLNTDFSLTTVPLDHIAEYVGTLDEHD